MNAIARRLCAIVITVGLSLLATTPAWSQTCPTGSINTLAAYNGQSNSQTVVNNASNNIYVGNSRLQLSHAAVGSGASIASNTISDAHISGDVGVRIGQSGADSTARYIQSVYDFRNPANLGQYQAVSGLTFRLHDIDAGDNVIVNAYDETGALINLTASGIYSFNTSNGTPVVSYATTAPFNRFTGPGGDIDDLRGSVYFNFGTRNVRQIVFQYYDTESGGTYTVADLRACNPTLTLYKTTQLIGGGPFGFTLTNTTRNTGATVTTSAAGTPEQVDGNAAMTGVQVFGVTPNLQVTINESSLPTNWSLVAASTTCTNASGTAIGSLSGTTYTIPAANTFAGAAIACTFTNAPPQTDVQTTKTATPNPVNSGQVVSYSIVVRNNGPNAVSNVLLTDTAGVGQNCSAPSTTATCSATAGATCPASIPIATLLGSGVTVPTLAVNSQVTVTVQCTVTASGVP
jgi:uncharacterized repeat protein (TIGR01451 family)